MRKLLKLSIQNRHRMQIRSRFLLVFICLAGWTHSQWRPTNGPVTNTRANDVVQVDSLILCTASNQTVLVRGLHAPQWETPPIGASTFPFSKHARFRGEAYVANDHWYAKVTNGPNGLRYGTHRHVSTPIYDIVGDTSLCIGTSIGVLMGDNDSVLTRHFFGLPLTMHSGDTTHYYYVTDVAMNSQYVFAATNYGLFRAQRTQMQFSIVNSSLPPIFIEDVYCKDSLLIAFAGHFIYRSVDNGSSWVMSNLFSLGGCNGILEADGSIFLGTSGEGIFESTNAGTNWIRPFGLSQTTTIYGGDEIDGKPFLALSAGLYFRDAGTWYNKHFEGLDTRVVSMVALPSGCIAAVAADDLHITNDGGNTWTQRALAVGFFPASMMTQLQGRLMLGNAYNHSRVLLADDCGSPWDTLDFGSNTGVFYLASDWEKSMVNLPGAYWLVTDSGNTTTSVQRPPAQDCDDDPVIFPIGDAIYATSCHDTVLLRSRDLGNTWVDCSNGMPPTDFVCYMERIGGRLFATFPNRIFQAIDGDSLWVASDFGIPVNSGPFFDLEYDGNRYYVCNGRRVWGSTDGMNWTDVSEGLPGLTGNLTYSSMALVDSVLYFGTWGHGVWKRPVSEMVVAAEDPAGPAAPVVFYPNPVQDVLRWTGGFVPKAVSCWNMMGQEVRVSLDGDGVDVSGLGAGMYVIRLEGRGGAVVNGKFMKVGR